MRTISSLKVYAMHNNKRVEDYSSYTNHSWILKLLETYKATSMLKSLHKLFLIAFWKCWEFVGFMLLYSLQATCSRKTELSWILLWYLRKTPNHPATLLIGYNAFCMSQLSQVLFYGLFWLMATIRYVFTWIIFNCDHIPQGDMRA